MVARSRRGTKADGAMGKQTMLPPVETTTPERGTGHPREWDRPITRRRSGRRIDPVCRRLRPRSYHWPKNGPLTNQRTARVRGGLPGRASKSGSGGRSDRGRGHARRRRPRPRPRHAQDTVAKFQPGDKKLARRSRLAKELGESGGGAPAPVAPDRRIPARRDRTPQCPVRNRRACRRQSGRDGDEAGRGVQVPLAVRGVQAAPG